MSKENHLKTKKLKTILYISIALNVLLCGSIYYIGKVKTNFFERLSVWMGIQERVEELPGDYFCLRGWTNTLKKLNYDADIVFFGNSITAGGNFQDAFPNVKTCNLGYPSDNLDGMILRIDQIKFVNPEKVFVMAGLNKLIEMSDEVFERKYQNMVDSIKASVPNSKIYLQSILPINHSKADDCGLALLCASNKKIIRSNEIIKTIAQHSGCVYVDLFSLYEINGEMPVELTRDGVHLKKEAYNKWIEEIRQYIE